MPDTLDRSKDQPFSLIAESHKDLTQEADIELRQTLAAISSTSILVYTDAKGNITDANSLFCKISGYSLPEIIGKNHRILKSGEHSPKFFKDLWKTISSGMIWTGDIKNRAKDGSYYWVQTSITPITDKNGKILKYLAIRSDITDKKNMIHKLELSEAKWKFAIESTGDGVWDWDIRNNVMNFSDRWKEMLGYEIGEIGTHIDECRGRIHPDDLPSLVKNIEDHRMGLTTFHLHEHRIRCKDGNYKWILHRGKIVEYDEDGAPLRMIGTQTDISARKKIEQNIREQSARLKSIFEGSGDAILLLSDEGFFDCNEQAVKLFQMDSKEELIRNHPHELSPEFQPDGSSSFLKAQSIIQETFAKGLNRFEWDHLTKNGQLFNAEVLLSAFEYGGKKILQATVRDITEKKRIEAELSQQREMMIASSKMASLGVMASGLAHEINNPLTVIMGLAGIMKLELEQGEQTSLETRLHHVELILQTAERISNIVKSLKTYSRENDDPRKVTEVAQVLSETLGLCKEMSKKRQIQLLIDSNAGKDLFFNVNPTQIGQVILNLLVNAFDAIEDAPEPWVHITVESTPKMIRINITDCGNGIPVQIVEKMMEPFFTTKEPGKGTGLGLSISRKILDAHHGKLYYDRFSENTRFVIEVPVSK